MIVETVLESTNPAIAVHQDGDRSDVDNIETYCHVGHSPSSQAKRYRFLKDELEYKKRGCMSSRNFEKMSGQTAQLRGINTQYESIG